MIYYEAIEQLNALYEWESENDEEEGAEAYALDLVLGLEAQSSEGEELDLFKTMEDILTSRPEILSDDDILQSRVGLEAATRDLDEIAAAADHKLAEIEEGIPTPGNAVPQGVVAACESLKQMNGLLTAILNSHYDLALKLGSVVETLFRPFVLSQLGTASIPTSLPTWADIESSFDEGDVAKLEEGFWVIFNKKLCRLYTHIPEIRDFLTAPATEETPNVAMFENVLREAVAKSAASITILNSFREMFKQFELNTPSAQLRVT